MKSWLNLYGFLFSKNWYVMKRSAAGWLVGADIPTSSDLSTSSKGGCPVTRRAVTRVLKCSFTGHLDHRMHALNRVSSHLVQVSLLKSYGYPLSFPSAAGGVHGKCCSWQWAGDTLSGSFQLKRAKAWQGCVGRWWQRWFIGSCVWKGASPVAQRHRVCLQCRRHRFNPWVGKIPLEEGVQPTAVSLPGESPWIEEPGGLQSIGLQRVRHNWSGKAHTHVFEKVKNILTLEQYDLELR